MRQAEIGEKLYRGVPVSEGIAIGTAHHLQPIEEDIPDFEISIGEVDAEVARYRKALFSSRQDLNQLKQDLAMEGSEEAISTIDTHIQMLEDPMITTHIEGKIRDNLRNTESVFRSAMSEYENRFSERTNHFFHERLVDVKDVSTRILGHLREKRNAQFSEIPTGSIVFCPEIAPSHSAAAHAAQIGAFVTQIGGGNSHAALIARAKGIPFVTEIEIDQVLANSGLEIVVDGYEGIVIVNPTKKTLEQYKKMQKQLSTRYQALLDQDHLPVQTEDGVEVSLYVNIGNPSDLDAFPYSYKGIGLFRTEYLFLETDEFFPSEQYQTTIYQSLIAKAEGRPVTIRLFDLGGDKNPSLFFSKQGELNPALGNRGIRFLLRNPHLLQMQLRAIFRSAKTGDVRILLPLICDINEIYHAKRVIEQVRLETQFDRHLPIGCMIEVPSSVMIVDAIAKECDFISIGTNDLVQFTLGIDRGNPVMSELFYPAHPSVLRMIAWVLDKTKDQFIPISICGEIASNTAFIPLLLGLGLREFSIAPRYLPYIKQVLRRWTIPEAKVLAGKALTLCDPKQVTQLLNESQKKL